MSYWMGIDGGGSNLRVAITDDHLNIIAQQKAETVNPGIVGHDLAHKRIRTVVEAVLMQAHLTAHHLKGVGLGIAGASPAHSAEWLQTLAASVMPHVPTVFGSDAEIALIGAHGKRIGTLVLAGTGSVAYGVNQSGQSLQVGGWGYLIGDEGGSYWIGRKALQQLTCMIDGRQNHSAAFVESLLNALGLARESELVIWLYHTGQSRNRDVAALAPVVLSLAEQEEFAAFQIVEQAAQELALLGQTVQRRLSIQGERLAFAGGLLERENILTRRLCKLLGLEQLPAVLYTPVVGAVLLAQLNDREQQLC